jgi:excisionase family DNA binding protein
MSRASKLPKLPPVDVNQRYAITEASTYLRQSRSKIYTDIANGSLQVIRDGGRIYIPGSEIVRKSTLQSVT